MKIGLALFAIGYAALVWSVIKIAMARHAAEARLRAAQHEHEALQAKYFTPPMTAAEIKEMHASRWLGD